MEIEEENKKCLHCGGGKPNYCEECYQKLIGENARLQESIDLCKATGVKIVGKETLLKNFISKKKVEEMLDDIEDYFYQLNGPDEDIEFIREQRIKILGGE